MVIGALGQSFGRAVDDAFAALGNRRSKAESRLLARVHRDLDRLLYFRPTAAKDYRDQGDVLEPLLRALVQHERVRIDYEASSGSSRQHDLEPLTLALYQDGLYLLARYRDAKRVYNFVVDRIAGVELSGGRFSYPAADEYHPQQVLSSSFGIFFRAKAGKTQRVKLVFADKQWLQVYLLERQWHPSQTFKQRKDGRLELTLELGNLVEVAQWVRGFGDDVEVVSPRGLLES